MRKQRIRRLILAATIAGLAAGVVPASAVSGTVTGTLLDDDTGGFAAGVSVSACGPAGCVTGGPSEINGRYTLALPAGNGWNVFTEVGDCASSVYARSHKYGVNVTDGGSVTVDLHLTRRRGSISGRVVDEAGIPIPGVGLVVDNAETGGFGISSSKSAADGSYRVDCLAAGSVAGSGTYYITAFPGSGSPFGQQQDAGIAVSAGTTSAHDVVLRQGGGVITGRVTCGGGACPAAVSVLVYCEGCNSAATTSTGAGGAYATGHLRGGQKYDVHAVAPAGWDNAIHYGVSVRDGAETTVGLDLVQSGPATSGSLTGVVSDATGAPYSQCLVNAFGGVAGTSAGGWTDGDVHTGEDGSFDTGYRLIPGDYLVFLVCPGLPQVNINGGRPVAVRAGAAATAGYLFAEQGRPFIGGHSVVGATMPTTQAFFAGGSTEFSASSSRHESISVLNPGDAQTLTVTYLFGAGEPVMKQYPLPAGASKVINVNAEVGPNKEVSAWLTAGSPFVAERSTYFRLGDGISGGTDVMGTPELQTSWYFAEGNTAPGFAETLQLMNPNLELPTMAAVTYYYGQAQPRTVLHLVPALGRLSVRVNDAGEAGDVGAVAMRVVSDFPIVAEREMAFRYGTVDGAHDVVGMPAPATSLNLAEGHLGGGFDEYLALLNPNDAGVDATVTYVVPGAPGRQESIHLNAASRTTVHLNEIIGGDVDLSIHIEAELPIVAERASYFRFAGWSGGDAAMALPNGAMGTQFLFAGHAGGPRSVDYYSLFNSGAQAATVTFTFPTATGPAASRTLTVAPLSRITEPGPGDGIAPGVAQISSSAPILVERVSYFAY